MGILDDAIRQHLDLKRRLGADDEELARLEDEAFGLPSRPGDPDFPETGSEPVDPVDGDPESPSQGPAPSAEPSAGATEHEPAAEAPVALAPTPAVEEPSTPAPPPTSGVDTVEHEFSAEPDEDDLDDTGEPPEPPVESLDTVEHSLEGDLDDTGEAEVVEGELEEPAGERGKDEGDDGEDEDVLEETPEFLREQPEDDELWFEQGEPKDFDF